MQTTQELEKAKQLFQILEIKTQKSQTKNIIRTICIQELLRDLKEKN